MQPSTTMPKRQWTIKTLNLPNDFKLRYGLYTSEEETIDRYVLFLNGHGEYIEKYDYLPDDLGLPEGVAFLTWDHRGQGASDGEPRSHVEDYDQLGKDAQFLIQKIVGKKPYTVIAHSMGGLIAVYSTMKGYLKPEKLLLSAPLFGVQHVIPQIVGTLIGNVATRLGLGKVYFQRNPEAKMGFDNNLFTFSRERFDRRSKGPYGSEGVTFGWIKATGEAIAYVMKQDNLAHLKVPTKILYGDDERLVATSAIKIWTERANKYSKTKVECIELSDTRHEIFAEAPASYNLALELTRAGLFKDGVDAKAQTRKKTSRQKAEDL